MGGGDAKGVAGLLTTTYYSQVLCRRLRLMMDRFGSFPRHCCSAMGRLQSLAMRDTPRRLREQGNTAYSLPYDAVHMLDTAALRSETRDSHADCQSVRSRQRCPNITVVAPHERLRKTSHSRLWRPLRLPDSPCYHGVDRRPTTFNSFSIYYDSPDPNHHFPRAGYGRCRRPYLFCAHLVR